MKTNNCIPMKPNLEKTEFIEEGIVIKNEDLTELLKYIDALETCNAG